MIDVEVLSVEHIDRKTFLTLVPQGLQQEQEQPVMHPELDDVAAHAVAVEDGAEDIDDLRHAGAEPALDMAEDAAVEMIQPFLASCGPRRCRARTAGGPVPPA